jgi:CheY-specific phosphatase CheX
MTSPTKTIDQVAGIICKATKHVLESSTRKKVNYSSTLQAIPQITMKPELGCFVQFTGDYNGLMVVNLSGDTALSLYCNYMLTMGLPEEELAKNFTSHDVADSIGEMTNQIMGLTMRMIQDKFNLTSFCGQPKALALMQPITLVLNTGDLDNRRLVFNMERHQFNIELAMEQTEFILKRN